MIPTSTRRDFIKGMTVACLPGALDSWGADAAAGNIEPAIANEYLAVVVDAGSGKFNVLRKNGAVLLAGATARANTGKGTRSAAERGYRRQVDSARITDALGVAQQTRMRCADDRHQLDFEVCLTLYSGRPAVLVEVICHNASSQSLTVSSLEPVRAVEEDDGGLVWPGVTRLLTNGPMYYDPGKIIDVHGAAAKGIRSWWNVALFRGYEKEGLVCGYVQNDIALGQLVIRPASADRFSLVAESVYERGFELRPGARVTSDRFMINLGPDPYSALEAYAQAMGDLQHARVHSILNGWCDWPYAFGDVTEAEMVRNAEFASRVLKPFGFEYVQVDEGFQRWHGDWEGNDRFAHGMKWLADQIRGFGLKPGIWLAPYVISEPTAVFREHPEWLLRHPDGRLRRVGPWPSEDSEWAKAENPKRYGLDITHPGAAEWLRQLFRTVAHDWGYELIKIDFVDWSLLAAERYYDPTITRAQAYRRGLAIMREAVGPSCHILDCGPGPVTVGLLDSMRIELDQPPVNWKQYFLESASSAPAMAKRYYFHKRTWINDADHVCLGLLTISQAQAAATLIALSGGNLILGDRLPDLDAGRLEILKKILPAYGEAARPVDLFDTDRQSVFALRVRTPHGEWTVAGFFNASETTPVEYALPLQRLWLDPRKTYVAYDFWREGFHGEVSGEVRLRVAPASVTLLALHEKLGIPQLISTDRHVLQGALEIESTAWDAATQSLTGVSLGPAGTAHNVSVYVPDARPWYQGGPFLFHDFPGYTLKMMSEHILRVRVRFEASTRVEWKVNVREFFAK